MTFLDQVADLVTPINQPSRISRDIRESLALMTSLQLYTYSTHPTNLNVSKLRQTKHVSKKHQSSMFHQHRP